MTSSIAYSFVERLRFAEDALKAAGQDVPVKTINNQ
jgi:hypothetical protein